MPTKSPYSDVKVPDVDLWAYMFDQPKTFSDSQVIYRSCSTDRKYTFADVKAAATTFGEGLCNLWDWQKGDVLNIYAPNDIDIASIVYGTFFAGGVVSPANPTYSPDELAFQLTNSESKAIVTIKAFLPNALKAAKKAGIPDDRILLLGEARDDAHRFKHWTNIRKTSGALRYRRRKAQNPSKDLAFLVYSSGTTGLPKGVMLSHANIVANLCMGIGAMGKYMTSGQDRIIAVLPFFHIYGLTALLLQSLARGLELIVMPAFDLKLFLETIQTRKITFVYVAPPILVRLARDKMVEDYDLSSLKMVTSGAAPLSRELTKAVHKRIGLKITQAYGLSETSPMTHCQPWEDWSASMGSVGKMFPNMTAKYMSADGKELGPGENGELWLAGPNIFLGYWKNEEATKNCTAEVDGVRYFQTGDVGYQDAAHNFYITDRVKELIKYKGFQVAPAELEGKLTDHPLVDDVAVIGVEDKENHTEVPRAYVVHASRAASAAKPQSPSGEWTGEPTSEQDVKDAEDIIAWTASKVANHKRLRGGIRFVPEIPKSASGKILRRVLKDRAKREETRAKL